MRTDLEDSKSISDFINLKQTRVAKNIPRTILKTRLKIKETITYTLVFRKLIVQFSGSLGVQIRGFLRYIKIDLE
jgi:hypothetical protein